MEMCTVEGMAINLPEKEKNSDAGSAGDGEGTSGRKKMMKYPVKQMKIQVSTKRKRTPRKVMKSEIYPKYQQLTCIKLH
jgi:hypothetical protein